MKRILACLLGMAMGGACAMGADAAWAQFRGPNASGVSDSAKPPVEFGPGTNQLWKISVPSGSSSPSVWGDRIFLTAYDKGKLETLCYQRSDGKLLWQREAPASAIEDYNTAEGTPAASTVAVAGNHVVSYFGSCGLICHDLDGKEIWKYALPVAQTTGGFGSGCSPVIIKGLVLLNRDQAKDGSLLAVDLHSGKKVWETSREDLPQSFGTPVFWRNDGADEVVMSGSIELRGYDLKTGEQRWSLAGMPAFTCTTPVVADDMLFFAGWSPGKGDGPPPPTWATFERMDKNHDGAITPDEAAAGGFGPFFKAFDVNGDGKITEEDLKKFAERVARGENVLVAVKPGGHGALTANSVAWKQTRGLPYVPSPLNYHGRIYIVRDGGMVSSFDAKTGQPFYQQERIDALGSYYASPVAADGRIYVASINGRVTVLAEGGDAPKILSRADFGERISATPALVDKALYLRTASALFAFGE